MVGNRREALLWDLQEGKIDEGVKPVSVKVGFILFSYFHEKCVFDHFSKGVDGLSHASIYLFGGWQ